MVFLDCGDCIAWYTPMNSAELKGEFEAGIIRCCGRFAVCVPAEKFGDGF